MKIIVYNYKNQFALSRKDIEVIANVLPKENILPIREFHLTFDETKPSIFEYSYETKKAYFAFPVKQKTSESLSKAVEQLLIGLARIRAKSIFGQVLNGKRIIRLPRICEKMAWQMPIRYQQRKGLNS